MVDQLRALDEAEERVEEYRRHYLERGQALVSDKDAWIKTWQGKVQHDYVVVVVEGDWAAPFLISHMILLLCRIDQSIPTAARPLGRRGARQEGVAGAGPALRPAGALVAHAQRRQQRYEQHGHQHRVAGPGVAPAGHHAV